MDTTHIKELADSLFKQAKFLVEISNQQEYLQALTLMDELVESGVENPILIKLLSVAINKWEDEDPELESFNQRINNLDSDAAVLRALLDQHQLRTSDLKLEIGTKGLVSMILNGRRQLTKRHIHALSRRFNVSPAIFFRRGTESTNNQSE